MPDPWQFTYTPVQSAGSEQKFRPILPLNLMNQAQTVVATGLLDTGADINILPYSRGVELGAIWQQQPVAIRLSGNLAQFEARVLVVMAKIAEYEPVQLVFAWTRAEHVPLILGQANFFMEYNVCFYRLRLTFEISPK